METPVSASLMVQRNAADSLRARCNAHLKTVILVVFGVVLCLAVGSVLSAETVKSKDVSSKPPAADKFAPGKTEPAASLTQTGAANPADCVQPVVGDKPAADGNELKDGTRASVSAAREASSSDLEVGAQSSSELITDKLKLSLEPRTSPASDSQAPQCGRDENGAQAKENGDIPSN